MRTLLYPRLDLDLTIISNWRIALAASLSGQATSGLAVTVHPFRYRLRGYVFQDGRMVAFFYPDAVDLDELWRPFHSANPPIEVFLLENDRIVKYREIWPPGGKN